MKFYIEETCLVSLMFIVSYCDMKWNFMKRENKLWPHQKKNVHRIHVYIEMYPLDFYENLFLQFVTSLWAARQI